MLHSGPAHICKAGKDISFFRWKQKLGAVPCCKLIPWRLSNFQLRITWWFVGSFFPSSILLACIGEAPLEWIGLEGPFLLWERKEDRKPPRDWRECAVLLWLQVISLMKNTKHHQIEYESVARQPAQRPPSWMKWQLFEPLQDRCSFASHCTNTHKNPIWKYPVSAWSRSLQLL